MSGRHGGAVDGGIHRYPLRVQFDDVDQYGIVHHPRYLIYMERARVDLMGHLGMRADRLDGRHLGLIVAKVEVKFLRSARFLDDLLVEQGCGKVGASRVIFAYRIARADETICTATLTLAFVDSSGKPVRAPEDLRGGLAGLGLPADR